MLYLPLHKDVPLSVVQKICLEVIGVVELVDRMRAKL